MSDAHLVATSAAPPLSSAQLEVIFAEVSNWGRWGADDQRGALNLIRPEHVVAAASLVREGRTVSMAHPIEATEGGACEHVMIASGAQRGVNGIDGYEASRDRIGLDVHGLGVTHLDALCHMFVDGRMYNGASAERVTATGAELNEISAVADGIVGRGVLLDVPYALGVDHVDPASPITVADLEATETALGVRVEEGDLLIVSTGRDARADALGRPLNPVGDGLAGMHPECLRWLSARGVALLCSDGISDPMPAGQIPRWPFPIHQTAITSMGLMLVDNLCLTDVLVEARAALRWEFLLHMVPLKVVGATGSPVNPVATF